MGYTKQEMKQIAKKLLINSVGVTYYKISDGNDYTEEEKAQIIEYINQYGTSMCKDIGERYIAY